VSDPWQGKGLGARLFESCITIARDRGIETLSGIVLPENRTMLSLARKLGFQITRSADASEYEIRMDLKPIDR
jgi:acetyltransferase